MWLVNENVDTRRLVFRQREGEAHDPSATVTDEVVVEFQENGRARVSQEVGERLVQTHDSIREAEGPEDVADEFERRQEVQAEDSPEGEE